MSSVRITPGMSFGDFLNQSVSQEEWDTEWDPPPKAPPQTFIGPACFAPKWLRCEGCGDWVQIPSKYRRAKKAWCSCCRD